MKFTLVLVGMLLASCTLNEDKKKNDQCLEDHEFTSQFQNCIGIITLRQNGHSIRYLYTANAYKCLEAITGYKSLVEEDGDTPLFYPYTEDKDYFFEDLKAWSRWYTDNKCTMTIEKADSILRTETDSIFWPPLLLDVIVNDSSYIGY